MQMTNWYKRPLYQLLSLPTAKLQGIIFPRWVRKKSKSIKWSSSYGRQQRDLHKQYELHQQITEKSGQKRETKS